MGLCQRDLDAIMERMKTDGLEMTHEQGVDDFLGINKTVNKNQDGTIHLMQCHLIHSIMDDLWLT